MLLDQAEIRDKNGTHRDLKKTIIAASKCQLEI